jgi:hypothetical protein
LILVWHCLADNQRYALDKRDFVLVLVLSKVQDMPDPKWMTLRIGQATNGRRF